MQFTEKPRQVAEHPQIYFAKRNTWFKSIQSFEENIFGTLW